MKRPLQNDYESQRQRLLAWLLVHHSITTLEARQYLDVMHPSGRIKELKEDGHNIKTHRVTENTDKGTHNRVARYVLLAGGSQ